MNENKTKATEISCAVGCFGLPLSPESACRVGNVSTSDAESVMDEKLSSVVKMTHAAGMALFEYLDTKPKSVDWRGAEKTTNASAAAKDVYLCYNSDCAMVPVSVKASSDVIWNGSTARFLEAIWIGGSGRDGTRGEHWFQKCAPAEYQAYFEACHGPAATGFPTAKQWDDARLPKEKRKLFAKKAKAVFKSPEVKAAYKALCEKVATVSAEMVNAKIEEAKKNNPPKTKLHEVLKSAVWEIFRINSEAYFLCGTEKTIEKPKRERPFVVRMPGKPEWSKRFSIRSVVATAKVAGQPEIQVDFTFEDSELGACVFSVKYEIRWSHGKFNGCPESKIYKMFRYSALPWARKIL